MNVALVLMAMRVETVLERGARPVPGSLIQTCLECRRPVYVSPATLAAAADGHIILCFPCSAESLAPIEHEVQPWSDDQIAEARELL